jgi:hypothetical protein
MGFPDRIERTVELAHWDSPLNALKDHLDRGTGTPSLPAEEAAAG